MMKRKDLLKYIKTIWKTDKAFNLELLEALSMEQFNKPFINLEELELQKLYEFIKKYQDMELC